MPRRTLPCLPGCSTARRQLIDHGGSTVPKEFLHKFNSIRNSKFRLVCFPHSGGFAGGFREWAALTPPGTELMAVRYPGRADRFAEPVVGIRETASLVATELLGLPASPLILYGHSLGALVAYETAVALRDAGSPPTRLCVSGSPGPEDAGGGTTHRLTDAELWSAVKAFGTIDPEFADDEEFRDLVLPALRADVTANETYAPRAGTAPLPCPVRCYYSPDDPLAGEAQVRSWSACTTGEFTLRARPGGHFHPRVDPRGLVEDVVGADRRERHRV
ncbi:alpha/beta fold hydrolase [Streptomyces sp. NPDC088194]|uniref:thioesterase II family protein n=1 Tax=Streptomyces sp. NPDC088194 TaxID=3154931 RepID=UPI00344EFEDF